MIVLIIKMIFLLCLWTMGWKIATAEEMVLEKVGKWGEKMAEKYPIFNGLIVCQWCLPNIHGLLFVYPLAIWGLEIIPLNLAWYNYLALYIFALGGASFCSGMLWQMYLLSNQKKNYYESGVAYHENIQKFYYNRNKEDKEKEKAKEKKS